MAIRRFRVFPGIALASTTQRFLASDGPDLRRIIVRSQRPSGNSIIT